jgi:hypothetical protein
MGNNVKRDPEADECSLNKQVNAPLGRVRHQIFTLIL